MSLQVCICMYACMYLRNVFTSDTGPESGSEQQQTRREESTKTKTKPKPKPKTKTNTAKKPVS